jgi:uncharacterized membrane protein YjgN (DUF898 family)
VRASGLRIFKLLVRFEHLAEQRPRTGVVRIEIDRSADVRFGVGEMLGLQVGASLPILVMRGGRSFQVRGTYGRGVGFAFRPEQARIIGLD